MMSPDWLSIILSSVGAIVTASITIGILKATASSLEKGQVNIGTAVGELTKVVQSLATSAAVNTAQHDELSRRITAIERTLGEQGEQVRVLRTKAHMTANKLMEIDPSWKDYRPDKDAL